jgi:hypothetical protein
MDNAWKRSYFGDSDMCMFYVNKKVQLNREPPSYLQVQAYLLSPLSSKLLAMLRPYYLHNIRVTNHKSKQSSPQFAPLLRFSLQHRPPFLQRCNWNATETLQTLLHQTLQTRCTDVGCCISSVQSVKIHSSQMSLVLHAVWLRCISCLAGYKRFRVMPLFCPLFSVAGNVTPEIRAWVPACVLRVFSISNFPHLISLLHGEYTPWSHLYRTAVYIPL